MKKFIKKRLQNLIRQTLTQISYEDEANRIAVLSTQAVFDPGKVRIDKQATIFNNRKDKKYIQIGDNSWLVGQLMTLSHGGEIVIGENCFIGENTRIWSSDKVIIGNRVLISHNVNIHDNISHPLDSTERHKDFLHVRHIGLQDNMDLPEQKIIIGDDVWIGFNCVILKGVTIGNKAIIGANTTITKDVPEMAVVVGNPSRIVKYTT